MRYKVEEIIFGRDKETIRSVTESNFPFHAIDEAFKRSLRTKNLIEVVDKKRDKVISTFN